ncbi:MAG: M14 family metallopeptidase [Bacteroidia bacterium]
MQNRPFFFFLLILAFSSCRNYVAKPYAFPKPVDTTTKPIEMQEKKIYAISEEGIFADNLFDGARLNGFRFVEGDLFQATISPENIPVNNSPYYAFRIWSDSPKKIRLELNYTNGKHRYAPKISADGIHWELLDSNQVELAKDSINAFLSLDISADTLWIAGQEVQNSKAVHAWCATKAQHPGLTLSSIGKSKLDRDLWLLDIHEGEIRHKDIIVILSRQHPPEVTGYFAMQAFVDEVLSDNPLSNAFRKKYHLLIFPLMNPDGVDMGHWRHSAGGVDLNRDWAYYNQPENRQIADYIVQTAKKQKSKVILGLDFHSTWWDVFYTNKEATEHLPQFKDFWLWGMRESLGTPTKESPSNVTGPNSKNWFFTQFGAPGVTYEIGDSTPRDFIIQKGKASATEMMELLIFKTD